MPTTPIATPVEVLDHLNRFGWLAPIDPALGAAPLPAPGSINLAAYQDVIREWFAKLAPPGWSYTPENVTRLIRTPRCNVPDRIAVGQAVCAWPHKSVTFGQSINLPGIPAASIARLFRKAALAWGEACGLTPREVAAQAEANVWAVAANLGGPGGVLAQAWLPCGVTARDRLMQEYDNREGWQNYTEAMLYQTILHEWGHSLGLDHDQYGTAMQPTCDGKITALTPRDIEQVVRRYGPPEAAPKPQPEPPVPPVPTDPTPGPSGVRLTSWRDADGATIELWRRA